MQKCDPDLHYQHRHLYASSCSALIEKEKNIMNKFKAAAAAMVLSTLSFGVFAADTVTQSASDNSTQIGITRASDVEAGSNIAPGSQSTGQSMNDAFDVHKLVAGEWS